MNKPKLITDLFPNGRASPETPATQAVVTSMLGSNDPVAEFAERQEEYQREMAMLERGGDDREGSGPWRAAMHKIGRKN